MKKTLLALSASALLLSASFIACSQSSDSTPDDDTVYALVNIPFEKFFEKETTDGNFDAYTSATQKAANGSMSYGTYYEEADKIEDSKTKGIITPVKISKAALVSLGGDEITDLSPAFDITISGRGASTIRYCGKQNLFKSEDYSYYILSSKPSYYKEGVVNGNSVSFGKLKGEQKKLGTLYVTVKAGEAHHDFSPTISLYTSDEELSDTVTSITVKQLQAFEGGEIAQTVTKAADGSETLDDKTLGELKTIIATASDGNEYGLTTLSNFFWGKKQIGFKAPKNEDDPTKNYYPQHELVGKTVVKLTFVTENDIYYTDNIVSGTTTTDSTKKVITFTPNADSSFVIENIQGR